MNASETARPGKKADATIGEFSQGRVAKSQRRRPFMSSLTYTDTGIGRLETADAKSARKPFWSRLLAAFAESQQRRAEREIARYLASRGPLTDEVEREIMRRLSGAKPL
jgi:hypothetical protein